MKTTLFALYRAPLNLWVEDPLNYSVLTDLWKDPEINVVITQGKAGVRHMVRSNPDPDRYCVYGVVDRDFDDDNENNWPSPDCRVLHLPVHELENLLLDFDVLAALAKETSAPQLREMGHAQAVNLHWWMVYKAVLREMQRDLGAGFPGDPPTDGTLRSAEDVEQRLRGSAYWIDHDAALRRWSQPATLADRVQEWGRRLEADLAGDAWMQSFSGKEIFRHLRSHVRGLDETPRRPPNPSAAERDLDLGKRIARQMNEMSRVPPKLTRLHQVLRAKAGL